MRINTETLRDEVRARGWVWNADADGWNIVAPDATATCINTKGPLSPEAIPTDGYPRLYTCGKIDKALELNRMIESCDDDEKEGG